MQCIEYLSHKFQLNVNMKCFTETVMGKSGKVFNCDADEEACTRS